MNWIKITESNLPSEGVEVLALSEIAGDVLTGNITKTFCGAVRCEQEGLILENVTHYILVSDLIEDFNKNKMKQYTVVFTRNNQEHTGAVLVDSCNTTEEEIKSAKEQATTLFNCEIADIVSVEAA